MYIKYLEYKYMSWIYKRNKKYHWVPLLTVNIQKIIETQWNWLGVVYWFELLFTHGRNARFTKKKMKSMVLIYSLIRIF